MWENQLQEILRTNDPILFEDWLITYEAETGDKTCRYFTLVWLYYSTMILGYSHAISSVINFEEYSRSRSEKYRLVGSESRAQLDNPSDHSISRIKPTEYDGRSAYNNCSIARTREIQVERNYSLSSSKSTELHRLDINY